MDSDVDCSSDVPSHSETESSSGLGNYDVAIYFHYTTKEKILDAEKILIEDGLTICLSHRDAPAARPKLQNLYSIAKRSDLRVFLITDKLVKEEFSFHLRLLENPDVSTKENTLLLMRRSQIRHIPEHVKDFTCKVFKDRIRGEDIADLIKEFRAKDGEQVSDFISDDFPNDEDNAVAKISSGINDQLEVCEENIKTYETKLRRFKELFGVVSKKRCYILIVSPLHERSAALNDIVAVPWIRVFDFDSKSRVNGLLSWTEEVLGKRHHTKTDQLDSIDIPNDDVTNWVFINGYTDSADTLSSVNRTIPPQVIYKHGDSLVEYCVLQKVPVILVMWYPTYSNLDKNFESFFSGLQYHFTGRLNTFNCIVCVPSIPNKRSRLYGMFERLDLLDNIIVVPVKILCQWLKSRMEDSYQALSTSSGAMTLPKYPDQGESLVKVEVDQEELVWIRTQVHILVMPAIDHGSTTIANPTQNKGYDFLKGHDIDWTVLENGEYDVKRDLLEEAIAYIEQKHAKTGKSGLVTIYHSPGGGGTTFARRLLFELRDKLPCGELKSGQIILKNLVDRLITIRNLTRLQTVLLLDGRSMHDVKKIMAICSKMRILVIHVRRYYQESEKAPSGDGIFFLRDSVSKQEANEFGMIYSKAAPENKSKLMSLSQKIENEEAHFVFEYGLTAFQSKYQGVRRYVHGYLQIEDNQKLQDWHTVLVFLSLANYYGHRGLPSKLFGKILHKSDNETVELEDLPHAARQFITEEEHTWKITYYIVSKLILEQVLVKRSTTEYDFSYNTLTTKASQELCCWATRFIENMYGYVGEYGKVGTHIYEILTSIFIRRHYDDPGENELESRPRLHYSKLLEETCSHTDKGIILKKLVTCFPNEAEFRAHLGRFHSKQGEFDQAEICFKLAIETKKNETRRPDPNLLLPKNAEQNRGDSVLERIYNMAGFACMSHIRTEIGVRLGNISERTLRGKSRPNLIRSCLEKAERAIKNFENGRDWYQNGSNPSFANLGELKVRLQLIELAKQISDGQYQSLLKKDSPYIDLGNFVLESFHECDLLLAHCISDRSRNMDIPEEEIDLCLNHFNFFFSNATKALEQWSGNDKSIHSMKCHLSMLKIKLRGQNRKWFRLNEDVKSTEQIKKFVNLCEKICDAVCNDELSKTRISSYMMEWLRAIRHKHMPRTYNLTDVLSRIRKWKARKEMGSLANFYHYVLATTLSLSSVSREIADAFSNESHKIKEHMRQNDFTHLHLLDTSEWLGRSEDPQSFNRLIPSLDLGEWDGRFWTNKQQISRLQVFTGSIYFCRPYDGIIIVDVGTSTPIGVFFVPQRYSIGVSHSKKKTRVEFYISFNPRRFAEAHEVTPLKKYKCQNPSCKAPTEIPTLGKEPGGCVAPCNMCDTIVVKPT